MSEAVGPIDFKTVTITNLHPCNRSQALIQTVMSLQLCQLNVSLLKLEYTLVLHDVSFLSSIRYLLFQIRFSI